MVQFVTSAEIKVTWPEIAPKEEIVTQEDFFRGVADINEAEEQPKMSDIRIMAIIITRIIIIITKIIIIIIIKVIIIKVIITKVITIRVIIVTVIIHVPSTEEVAEVGETIGVGVAINL